MIVTRPLAPTDAVSIDAATAARLCRVGSPATRRLGSVHSVHHRVINLLDPRGHLVALASDELDDAPRTIRISAPEWAALAMVEGEPVLFGDGELALRSAGALHLLRLHGARRWEPRDVEMSALTSADLLVVCAAVDAILAIPAARSPFEEASAAFVIQGLIDLEAALLHGDHARTATAAGRLVGLGTGLTPAGDDILTGLALLAAQPGMRIGAALPTLSSALADAAERTTLLSAVTLHEALSGRGRQRLHDLLAVIAAIADVGDSPTGAPHACLEAALLRVRAIGHSSGADILTGIRLGLSTEAALREQARHGGDTQPIPQPVRGAIEEGCA